MQVLPATAKKMPPAAVPITDEAQRVYGAYGDAIYQVQTIDLTSGKKSSIGSGFQFTADGLVATNYHVVASAANHHVVAGIAVKLIVAVIAIDGVDPRTAMDHVRTRTRQQEVVALIAGDGVGQLVADAEDVAGA